MWVLLRICFYMCKKQGLVGTVQFNYEVESCKLVF